ncbi:hypothetical protein HanIR_Chr06g0275381 [Helianthus annuus]|nr:hypothetical protein HanIR_Chr06g0275381 [Helianthus annuus]
MTSLFYLCIYVLRKHFSSDEIQYFIIIVIGFILFNPIYLKLQNLKLSFIH